MPIQVIQKDNHQKCQIAGSCMRFRYISLEIVPIVISLRLQTAGKNYVSLPIMAPRHRIQHQFKCLNIYMYDKQLRLKIALLVEATNEQFLKNRKSVFFFFLIGIFAYFKLF